MRVPTMVLVVLAGMMVTTGATADGTVRNYYIAADPVIWDYTPTGRNEAMDAPFGEEEMFHLGEGIHQLGSKLAKSLYREYTDDSFTVIKPRPKEWQHLGYLGPLIRAEVGDTIRVVFRNNTHHPASVHPHGVFYNKDSEGAPYADGTTGADRADDAVPTGATHVYSWQVRDRTGPADGGSIAFWMYHSHANEAKDMHAGLVGPMLITAKGAGRADLSPKDVDREIIVGFNSTAEASSWHVLDNIATYYDDPASIRMGRDQFGAPVLITPHGETLAIYENLNGFLYGSMPMLTMKQGERVRWYLMAGTGFEVHAPHWHGNTGVMGGMRVDTTALTTMGMQIVDMIPDAVGTWLFHCHVDGHFAGGMVTRYQVLAP